MKATNIFSIQLDGMDGCGKTTLLDLCQKNTNFELLCYDRGELSYYVYAKKYNRTFMPTIRGLPIAIVFLKCREDVLKDRITKRANENNWSTEQFQKEIDKLSDETLFEQAAKDFENDYHIITIDVSDLTPNEVYDELMRKLGHLIKSLPTDDKQTSWNDMYEKGCAKLGLDFKVRSNQPYINNIPFMSESTNQNGVYEKFDVKDYPTNMIFMRGYDLDLDSTKSIKKTLNFSYIINSKIKRRHEIYDYYSAMEAAGLSCMVSDNELIPHYKNFVRVGRIFGDDFVLQQAKARATVYCARDLAYLELQTARLYEAILARQVVFVDKQSDPENKILRQIHSNAVEADLLQITPQSLAYAYMLICDDENWRNRIVERQLQWYSKLMNDVKGGKFNA